MHLNVSRRVPLTGLSSPAYGHDAGRWEERGRDRYFFFDRKLLIKPLINLVPWHQGEVVDSFDGSYGPVLLSGLGIEVDTGADIVYRK